MAQATQPFIPFSWNHPLIMTLLPRPVRTRQFNPLVLLLAAALLLCLPGTQPLRAAELFPLYPCIRTNVKFWEDIYSRYTTTQGVIHDMDDLSRIYGVIDLVSWEESDSARINKDRIKEAKDRVIDILTDLGDGKRPATAEEQRIAALFPPQRHTTFHKARENLRVQIGQKDRYYEGLLRSGRYLAHFKQYFASQGLPRDLAYLPHVESSFNPKACSKVGAAGLWQFTRATGKEYMRVDDQIDERLDPYLATRAATRLLKQNYDQLGSWPLALTAYNHGRTGVQRALNEMGSYENIFKSYDQGSFQFASRNFYSEFLAAMRVAKRMEGDPKVPFERPEATVTFQLKQTIPAATLTNNFRLSREEFARLNPALQDPILSGQRPVPKGYLLRLPPRDKQVAGARRQTAPKAAAASIRQQPLRVSPDRQPDARPRTALRYKVHKGDTSYSIARQHGITHQELMAANGRSAQAAIRIGETLVIPTRGNDLLDKKTMLNRQPNS